MIQSQQFRAVRRPQDLSSPYALVVVDGSGVPHFPLTVFYHETQRFLAEGTVKTYLATLLPYFDYLMTNSWRRERKDRWDSSPDAVRESVRDFLVEQLHCKAQPRETDQLVRLTGKSPSTVHVFLCALKQFYHLARRKEWYPYPHPLTDPTANLLQDTLAEERREAGQRPRMPQRSGVEEPRHKFLSDNYFKLVHETWQPHPIDDPQLHRVLRQGFPRAGFCLRDQIVVRMAYESGARIREILRLTIGDWRKRGGKQEAWAFSKGSHGRRVKVVRWSAETSRMLLAYVNTERMAIDRQGYIYTVTIWDNYSRQILASGLFRTQDLTAYLTILYQALAHFGIPEAIVSDSGSIFLANLARQIYQKLGIRKVEIDKGQSWENYAETLFNINRRLADHWYHRATSWEEIADIHVDFVRKYNEQEHFAHRKRADGRRTPQDVLGWVKGREIDPAKLDDAFTLRIVRQLDQRGYMRFQNWRIYAEEGLARRPAELWIYHETLSIQFTTTLLAQYPVHYHMASHRLLEVGTYQAFSSHYQSPQLFLWQGEDILWRPAYKLDAPSRRSSRRRLELIQDRLFSEEAE